MIEIRTKPLKKYQHLQEEIDVLIYNAKKEVFDDIEKEIIKMIFEQDAISRLCDVSPSVDLIFKDIKERHLSHSKH